jgi:L-ascorbate metabolism protein UlaG (beta-lactamase superfamily)
VSGFNLRFLGHSTVRLELGGRVVLTDPVLPAPTDSA